MSYKNRLNNWAIARLLPDNQWIVIARFRIRSDAEGHFQFLCRAMPEVQFKVVFDVTADGHLG